MAHILFLDNFDSFTYNLVDEFRSLNHKVDIYQNNCSVDFLIQEIRKNNSIVALSPGSGSPKESGNLLALIEKIKHNTAIIGICLGHQAILESFGGKIIQAKDIVHGKITKINHDEKAMFYNLKNPMSVARYHSLIATNIPNDFIINAHYNNQAMAVRHKTLPICSFQFHPESILTLQGTQLLNQSIDWLLKKR